MKCEGFIAIFLMFRTFVILQGYDHSYLLTEYPCWYGHRFAAPGQWSSGRMVCTFIVVIMVYEPPTDKD